MKTKILHLIVALGFLGSPSVKTFALNYTISFTGTGASSTIDSVIVQNLTKGTKVTVPARNVLNLSDVPTAVEQFSANNETIRVYAASVDGKSRVSFFSKQAGVTQLSVFSIDGRKVAGISIDLQTGSNTFELSLPIGVFVIQVTRNEYAYTAKVLNQTGTQCNPGIVYTGTDKPASSGPQKSKSSALGITTMTYTAGDRLLYKGVSGIFSTIITDVPTGDKTTNFNFVACTDADGNNYTVVTIGSQTWIAENLKSTHYNDSTAIPLVTDNNAWGSLTTPGYCWYGNDSVTYKNMYGALYNWYTVNTGKLAPKGWHVATDAEWTILDNYFTGFSALPGGYRGNSGNNGTFYDVGGHGYWWSATGSNTAWGWYLDCNSGYVLRYLNFEQYGYSVRCVRDILSLSTLTTTVTSSITTTTATTGGNITNDGGAPIIARGICWSTSANPTISDSITTDGTGTGTFISALTGLTANTTYNVRAYATNSVGTAYGTQVSFTTPTATITDIDGNVYHTVTIGTQTWMVENMKTTRYNDGTAIPLVTDSTAWANQTTPGYCLYNNDAATYKNKYGALYNWYTVNTGKLAPTGWHVPTDAEWTTLTDYVTANLGTSQSVPISLAATIDWATYSWTGAIGNDLSKNNSTGFSALPGGYRYGNSTFGYVGFTGIWWSSTESSTGNGWYRVLDSRASYVGRGYSGSGHDGFSVRCVRDN